MWSCQVVTCVPTSVLPKRCRQVGQETDTIIGDNGEADDDVIDEMGERGHILWIRGLSRLQHQVGQHTAQYKRGRVSARASNWSTLFECGVFVSVFCIILLPTRKVFRGPQLALPFENCFISVL